MRQPFCIAMEDNTKGNKVSGIRQIVKLKGMLQKWQHVTLSPRAKATTNTNTGNEPRSSPDHTHGGISPAISRRLRISRSSYCDSDEDCQSPESPFGVPKGYLAVYVGPEALQLRRFIIPMSYLSHPLFKVLLEKVEEEYGFDHSGGITIPCEVETFKFLLNCMEIHKDDDHLQLDGEAGETSLTVEE